MNRGARDEGEPIPVAPAVVDAPSPALPRLRRRRLRSLAAQRGDLRPFNLRGASLGGLDLAGIDLGGCDLRGATFRKSTLSGARLAGAVLDYTDLSRCDLRGADLSGASLLDADFADADLTGADLTDCRRTAMVNLRGARFDRTTRWPPGVGPDSPGVSRSG